GAVAGHVGGCRVSGPVTQDLPEPPPVLDWAGVFLVSRDVPDIPLARERQCLTLRRRLALASLCGADRRDARLSLRHELGDAHLGRPHTGREGQPRFPSLTVEPLVFGADILEDDFAADDGARLGDARTDHAKQHLYLPFVLRAGQMRCCSSNLLNPLGFEARWCGREIYDSCNLSMI